jgi:hypothetical protein
MTDDPLALTLKDAAERYGLTVATLRAEHQRGRLTIYKIGKRFYTSPESIKNLAELAPRPMPLNGQALSDLMFCPSGIYVVGFAGFVKIGWSSLLEKRIAEIQQGVPLELTLHACLEGGQPDERLLHRRFRKYRTRGEWFRHEGELAEWIKRGCQ